AWAAISCGPDAVGTVTVAENPTFGQRALLATRHASACGALPSVTVAERTPSTATSTTGAWPEASIAHPVTVTGDPAVRTAPCVGERSAPEGGMTSPPATDADW